MMPPGAFIWVSVTARMLAGAAPDGLLRAGRGGDELLEERERFARAGHRADAVQRVQGARSVRGDLALQLLTRPQLVEDLADALDALDCERCGRREERGQLGTQARRGLLERDDD